MLHEWESEARAHPGTWGCARHALLGKTCCQTFEIFVTEGDKRRIASHTGGDGFWENRAPNDPAYLDHDDDPNWLAWAFLPGGIRPILKRQLGGDCTFLGSRGCLLPLDVRPLVCRLYPYTYTERGIDGVSDGCPDDVVPEGRSILEVLDMRQEEAERWHLMLYTELRSKKAWDENRADL